MLTLLLLLWRLLWQHRHQLPQLSHRTWVAIDRIVRSLANQPSPSEV
ncbi:MULTISPECIES: hypothetical protein [unclassified Microcoleus]